LAQRVSRYLGELEHLEAQPEEEEISGYTTVPREEFIRLYQRVRERLSKLQYYRHQEYIRLAETLQSLDRLRYPDSTFSLCRYFPPLTDSCLVVSRSYVERVQEKLARLQAIYQARTQDSTLLFSHVRTPKAWEDLWGNTFFQLSANIHFRNAEGDTIYTLKIQKLKGRIQWILPFWKLRGKVYYTYLLSGGKREGVAIGLGGLNVRRLDANLWVGTRGIGGGIGFRLTRNFGPFAGWAWRYGGGSTPLVGLYFSLI